VGETIDANAAADARPPRFSARVVALLGMLLVVLLAAVVLAQFNDEGGAAPDSSEPSPTSPKPGLSDTGSESTAGAPDTSTPSVLPSSVDSTAPAEAIDPVPPETFDPVSAPSAQDATFSVTDFLERLPTAINAPASDDTTVTRSAEDVLANISDSVTGAMAEEVLATAAEFEAMGWTQSGTPEIVDVRVVRAPTPQEPLDAIVEVCLDSSNVQILDESGRNVRPADTPQRSLNIFVLRLVDGSWLVAERTFPADPDC
jgi:hypothetical protein